VEFHRDSDAIHYVLSSTSSVLRYPVVVPDYPSAASTTGDAIPELARGDVAGDVDGRRVGSGVRARSLESGLRRTGMDCICGRNCGFRDHTIDVALVFWQVVSATTTKSIAAAPAVDAAIPRRCRDRNSFAGRAKNQ